MNALFRVALSGDFKKPDGSPTFPDFVLKFVCTSNVLRKKGVV